MKTIFLIVLFTLANTQQTNYQSNGGFYQPFTAFQFPSWFSTPQYTFTVPKVSPPSIKCAKASGVTCLQTWSPVCGLDSDHNELQTFQNSCQACQQSSVYFYPGLCQGDVGIHDCGDRPSANCSEVQVPVCAYTQSADNYLQYANGKRYKNSCAACQDSTINSWRYGRCSTPVSYSQSYSYSNQNGVIHYVYQNGNQIYTYNSPSVTAANGYQLTEQNGYRSSNQQSNNQQTNSQTNQQSSQPNRNVQSNTQQTTATRTQSNVQSNVQLPPADPPAQQQNQQLRSQSSNSASTSSTDSSASTSTATSSSTSTSSSSNSNTQENIQVGPNPAGQSNYQSSNQNGNVQINADNGQTRYTYQGTSSGQGNVQSNQQIGTGGDQSNVQIAGNK